MSISIKFINEINKKHILKRLSHLAELVVVHLWRGEHRERSEAVLVANGFVVELRLRLADLAL